MTASITQHTVADAFIRLGELIAKGRVYEMAGAWRIDGTDLLGPCEEIADAMEDCTVREWIGGNGRAYRTIQGSLLGVRTYLKHTTDDRVRDAALALLAPDSDELPADHDRTPMHFRRVRSDDIEAATP